MEISGNLWKFVEISTDVEWRGCGNFSHPRQRLEHHPHGTRDGDGDAGLLTRGQGRSSLHTSRIIRNVLDSRSAYRGESTFLLITFYLGGER